MSIAHKTAAIFSLSAISYCLGASFTCPVPNNGNLEIVLPDSWQEIKRSLPINLPPTVHFERKEIIRGEVEITVFWSPKNDPNFTAAESIKKFTKAGQKAIMNTCIEKELPLISINGVNGTGFYYSATDKTYSEPPSGSVRGEFPVITHGELGFGKLLISFTIFSDTKADIATAEVIHALQSCYIK
jgi:hypothetical protein